MTKTNENPVLSEKDQEIIAVGASIASGCLPCTKFHLRAAAGVGAAKGEILQAVDDATRVRREATEILAGVGGSSPSGAAQAGTGPTTTPSRTRELVAVAAAYAINCSTGLEAHMKAARALGATDGQLVAAIRIACAVAKVASQKAKAMAGSVLDVSEEQAVACDCDDADAPPAGETPCVPPGKGQRSGACSCRPGDDDDPLNSDQ